MSNPIHSRARTTPLTRQEIKDSPLPQHALAKLYNVTRQTIRKWQQRETVADASHRPHTLDDLTAVAHQFINAAGGL